MRGRSTAEAGQKTAVTSAGDGADGVGIPQRRVDIPVRLAGRKTRAPFGMAKLHSPSPLRATAMKPGNR